MSQPSLHGDANSLLFELNECEKMMEKKAPGVFGFKTEISRMKMDAEILVRMAAELDIANNIQRRHVPRQKFDELAQAIQRLRSRIIYFKSHLDLYKNWYHNDSPRSDTGNYSSDSGSCFSPMQPKRGTGTSGSSSNSSSWFQPPPPRFQVQNRYSQFPSQMQSSQCDSCGRSSQSSGSSTNSDSCRFCGYVSQRRSQPFSTPPHYSYPARPGM